MADTVVTSVARRLSCRAHEAEEALRRFSRDLRGNVRARGGDTIYGLGTFKPGAEGLVFEPDDMLLAAAWASLDTLDPLAVAAPSKEPVKAGGPATAEGTTQAMTSELEAEPAPESGGEDISAAQALESAEAAPEPDAQDTGTVPAAETAEAVDPPVPREDPPTHRSALRHRDRTMRAARRRWPWALAGAVVVVAALLLLRPDPQAPEPQDPVAAQDSAAQDSVAEAEAGLDVAAQDAVAPPADGEETPVVQAPPARGLDRTLDGYTIIVASFDEPGVAAEEAARYRALVGDAQLPVDVMRSADGTKFRVAIGQRPTIDAAVALRAELTVLPQDAWILRIAADL